jgi:hypothetical protein
VKDVRINQAEPRTETSIETKARIEYVPHSRLCPSPLNVRKMQSTSIESLAETIYEQGLIQNNGRARNEEPSEAPEDWRLCGPAP